MPIIKSAKKKMRKDAKRTLKNKKEKDNIKKAIKTALTLKKGKDVKKAISLINKAAKKNIFHKNKAARLTSRLSQVIKTNPTKSPKGIEKKLKD